jgi:UDPglucose 6-dehydrogenase
MRITVIGTGYVGLVSGACLADVGHDVVCVDVDPKKVEVIQSGRPGIHEPGLASLLEKHSGRRLHGTTDLAGAVARSDVTIIAVGTPFNGEQIDLTAVQAVARQVGQALSLHPGYCVIAVKSTVVPGTTDNVVIPLLEQASGKRAGQHFGVAMNPEFLAQGRAVDDFLRPDRIVLGGIDERSVEVMAQVYEPFADAPVLRTKPCTAEMIKYASNTLLATLISLSNEIANLSSALGGIDAAQVMEGVHLSRYLAAQTPEGKPVTAPLASFFYPGCGFGGSCLPKDTKALAALGASKHSPMRILEAVIAINEEQPARMLGILRRHFPHINGLRVGVLGLSYRPDTNDMRDSPAIPIVRALIDGGAAVQAYDPAALSTAGSVFAADPVRLCETLETAVDGTDALLLVTRWPEFDRLALVLDGMTDPPVVIDGRRMLDPSAFANYDGIGL